ncbi:MAG: type II toxin-antitoxin system VapC family toxin [Chloroflexi bacterium]|nr:type II toxin-antitoxin system VapC family toxin [Chloroflexota bacterium]
MILYYLDASVWVKRYFQEQGTDWIQSLFAQNPKMACASLGVVEVMATLARKRKAGEMEVSVFDQKTQQLEEDWKRFTQIQFTLGTVESAKKLAKQLAIRGADAVHLASVVLLKEQLEEDDELVFVASDRQLKEAAQTSGLTVIDPAEQDQRARTSRTESQ